MSTIPAHTHHVQRGTAKCLSQRCNSKVASKTEISYAKSSSLARAIANKDSLPIFRVALASDTVSSRFCGLRSRWIRCRLHKNSSPLAGEHEEVSTRAMQAAELSFSQLHTTAPSWHMKLVETGSDKVLFVLMNLWRSPPPQYSNRR